MEPAIRSSPGLTHWLGIRRQRLLFSIRET